jgi:hypothetical protein
MLASSDSQRGVTQQQIAREREDAKSRCPVARYALIWQMDAYEDDTDN